MPKLDSLWFGVGFEVGGEIIAGIGNHQGALFCYGDSISRPELTRYCTIEQRSVTIGLGLGGSGGFTFLIGLNAAEPQSLGQAPGWSLDFSLDMGIGGLAKYVRTAPQMIELAAIAAKFNRKGLKLAEFLTKYEKNRYLMKDVADGLLKNHGAFFDTVGGGAGIVSLPMPGANYGLRFSVKTKYESTVVTNWGTTSFVVV